MTFDELKDQLDGMGVTPPDVRRASLYLPQLREVRTYFHTTMAGGEHLGANYPLFETALKDVRLLNEFCEIMDDFISPAVSADLIARANPGNRTYNNYFDHFILNANYNTNVTNFMTAYPATNRAILSLTANFRTNIETACNRILDHWDDIGSVFTGDNSQLDKLIRIKSSGSDFHKGGKQVLILTFELYEVVTDNEDGAYPIGSTMNLMYKPSDIEADCLIAGDSEAVNSVHAGFQDSSLFEIFNDLVEQIKSENPTARLKKIPVYKILPYDYGSSFGPAAPDLPVRNSYGFIEFLEHRHEPGLGIFGYYPFGYSDFKIFPNDDAAAITREFYWQIGELTALASSFSLIDLHMENMIAAKMQPHLIDLEICLTRPIQGVGSTGMFGTMGSITGEQLEGVIYSWVVRGVPGNLYMDKAFRSPYRQNRLWTMTPNAVVPVNANVNALLDGYIAAMAALRRGVQGVNVFTPWFARLNDAVVRYLPYSTREFQDQSSIIYNEDHVADEDYYQTNIMQNLTIKYNNYQHNHTAQPKFLCWEPDYTEEDFQHCDIPVYYHRVGTTGVVDSRGVNVAVPDTIAILNDHPPPEQVNADTNIGRDTYFENTPTTHTVRNGQVNILGTDPAYGNRVELLQDSILAELGLDAVPDPGGIIHV